MGVKDALGLAGAGMVMAGSMGAMLAIALMMVATTRALSLGMVIVERRDRRMGGKR